MSEEDCTCEGTGQFYCKVVETPCTEDADCDGDWICLLNQGAVSGGETPPMAGGGSDPAPGDADAGSDDGEEDEELEGICIPGGTWGEAISQGGIDFDDLAQGGYPGAADGENLGGGTGSGSESPADPTAADGGTGGTPVSTAGFYVVSSVPAGTPIELTLASDADGSEVVVRLTIESGGITAVSAVF